MDADEEAEAIANNVIRATDRLPHRLADRPLAVRPSAVRLVPIAAACLAISTLGALPGVPLLVRLLALPPFLYAVFVVIEVTTHRIIIRPDAVTDTRWRSTSTTDGRRESYTIIDQPDRPFRLGRGKHQPVSLVWTDTQDRSHTLALSRFSTADRHLIIAGVHALRS